MNIQKHMHVHVNLYLLLCLYAWSFPKNKIKNQTAVVHSRGRPRAARRTKLSCNHNTVV